MVVYVRGFWNNWIMTSTTTMTQSRPVFFSFVCLMVAQMDWNDLIYYMLYTTQFDYILLHTLLFLNSHFSTIKTVYPFGLSVTLRAFDLVCPFDLSVRFLCKWPLRWFPSRIMFELRLLLNKLMLMFCWQ